MPAVKKILIIQTAFTGDVVLATALVETLAVAYPEVRLDFLVRKGNEGLVTGHPILNSVLVWDKKSDKYRGLWRILKQVRAEGYDAVINLQRFAATGLLTAFSGARLKFGFSGNLFSLFYSHSATHDLSAKSGHEIKRNHALVQKMLPVGAHCHNPRLYPSASDFEKVKAFTGGKYVTISPASVWFTKQWPTAKWAQLIDRIPADFRVFLLGGPGDKSCCEEVKTLSNSRDCRVLAGELSLLQSAALMAGASMNFTNDSAPLHMAGAMGAPVSAVFCSTVPSFGFGPFLPSGQVVQTSLPLDCRPCGIHGKSACPKGHFLCALDIDADSIDLSAVS